MLVRLFLCLLTLEKIIHLIIPFTLIITVVVCWVWITDANNRRWQRATQIIHFTVHEKNKKTRRFLHFYSTHKNNQVSIFSIMPEVFCWLCDMQEWAYLSSYVQSYLGPNVWLGPNFGKQLDRVSLLKNNLLIGLKSGKLQSGWELGIGWRRLCFFSFPV